MITQMSDTLKDLLEQRDAADEALQTFIRSVSEEKDGKTEIRSDVSDADVEKVAELTTEVDELDERIGEVNAELRKQDTLAEARKRIRLAPGDGVIRSEARTYGPENRGNSYFADMVAMAYGPGDIRYAGAVERFNQHGKEMARDAVNDSEARSRLTESLRETFRKDEGAARRAIDAVQSRSLDPNLAVPAEFRTGMDTTGGSGGSFVTPQYLVSDYAAYRQYGRVFCDLANSQDLPDYGMTVYLPHVESPAGVSSQATQNTGVNETDPTAGYLSANLVTEAGQVTVSQQLLDRAGPGIQFDVIVFDQLQRAYNQTFNQAVLTAALANAGTITDSETEAGGANVVQDLYSDVARASAAMETTEGTILPPTHVFATGVEWAFVESQLDSNGRPLIVPSYAGAFNAIAASLASKENIVPEGDTGFSLLSLPVFKDNGIPTTNSGADTQVVVAHMPEVWVWEGPLVPRTIPQTFAQNLSVLLQVYSYNAVIVRYPIAVQSISGARYPVSPTFPYSAS